MMANTGSQALLQPTPCHPYLFNRLTFGPLVVGGLYRIYKREYGFQASVRRGARTA